MFHKNRRFLKLFVSERVTRFEVDVMQIYYLTCNEERFQEAVVSSAVEFQAPIYCSSGDWLLVPGDVGHVVAIYSSGLVTKS